MRSLTVHAAQLKTIYGHVSLQGRSVLPLELITSLETLDFNFGLSCRVFEPKPSHGGLSLASAFPHLTSLSIQSLFNGFSGPVAPPLPKEWADSLPASLTFLKVNVPSSPGPLDPHISPSVFDSLPKGLKHLEIGTLMPIDAGPLDLRRFPDLRVLRLARVYGGDALEFLPSTLEELSFKRFTRSFFGQKTTLSLSKLPPRIRILHLAGSLLCFDCDSPVPDTLEELYLESSFVDLDKQKLEHYFKTKRLRKCYLDPLDSSGDDLCDILTNVESSAHFQKGRVYESLEKLPRKLKAVSLTWTPESPSINLQHLPPALEELIILGGIHFDDFSHLPRTLLHLSVPDLYFPSTPLSSDSFSTLPSRLTRLDLPLSMFESEQSLGALPETIEFLVLKTSDCACLQRLSFPKAMKSALKTLKFGHNGTNADDLLPVLANELKDFARLSTLTIAAKVAIRSGDLSNLPSSLTDLRVSIANLANYGLPEGQALENADWNDGVFSRLPLGLLQLFVYVEKTVDAPLDYKVYSKLPAGLSSLTLDFCIADLSAHPAAFFATLPRRIGDLNYRYLEEVGFTPENAYECVEQAENMRLALLDAFQEYYSDPFWEGFHRHKQT